MKSNLDVNEKGLASPEGKEAEEEEVRIWRKVNHS
jgi:hypothetical protein